VKVYFMRHGEASWRAACDAERPLTDQGVVRLRKALSTQAAQMGGIDCILHSPYLRAVQTAQIAAEVLNVAHLIPDARWTPDCACVPALESLEAFEDKTVLVVTHNPLVSTLVGLLCHCERALPEPFDTGTIACVEMTWPAAGLGSLIWKF
jgi:phosphohistidine phosphatase